jgi:hypothetical protein
VPEKAWQWIEVNEDKFALHTAGTKKVPAANLQAWSDKSLARSIFRALGGSSCVAAMM